jgi:hypothetical protein
MFGSEFPRGVAVVLVLKVQRLNADVFAQRVHNLAVSRESVDDGKKSNESTHHQNKQMNRRSRHDANLQETDCVSHFLRDVDPSGIQFSHSFD